MKRKRAGLAILVLLAALLVALPALVGCGGGGKGEENVIVIGISTVNIAVVIQRIAEYLLRM